MDKFSSKVHRVHMELGGKLLNSLRIKHRSNTQVKFEVRGRRNTKVYRRARKV